jgi:hypothetical protein
MPLPSVLSAVVFQAPITGSVKHGFQGVDLKVVFFIDMFLYFVKQITLQVNKLAACFAFQVKMFLTGPVVPDMLVTGASFT